jgi:hypothetical protein
LGGLRSY